MKPYFLDIYLDEVNKGYLNKLTFQTLFRSRSLGYHCSSELFCDAYNAYSEGPMNEEMLQVIETSLISCYIIRTYELNYKDELIFMIRNPRRFKYVNEEDEKQKIVRKKVLKFFDIEEPENSEKKEAYLYLKSIRPVMRAEAIHRILKQYLILSHNEYYIRQASLRMVNGLIERSEFDSEGNAVEPTKTVIDSIWHLGDNSKRTTDKE